MEEALEGRKFGREGRKRLSNGPAAVRPCHDGATKPRGCLSN